MRALALWCLISAGAALRLPGPLRRAVSRPPPAAPPNAPREGDDRAGNVAVGRWKLRSTTDASTRERVCELDVSPMSESLPTISLGDDGPSGHVVSFTRTAELFPGTSFTCHLSGSEEGGRLVWEDVVLAELVIMGLGMTLPLRPAQLQPKGTPRSVRWRVTARGTLHMLYGDDLYVFDRANTAAGSRAAVPLECFVLMQILSHAADAALKAAGSDGR